MVHIDFAYIDEEEEYEEDEDWMERARYEIVEFLLRRYGLLRSSDIAKILNWKVREVNSVLKDLESCGRVRKTKIGKSQMWCPIEDIIHNPMYY
ncbi:MAG: hypothetical protein QXX33_04775 [Candidatus Hadarchaeales archaeon]